MAEETSGEKIFPATAHRRAEARKKGTVAKSMDLSGALVLTSLIIAVHQALTSGSAYEMIRYDLYQAFAFNPHPVGFNLVTYRHWDVIGAMWLLRALGPVLAVAFIVGFIVNIGQVGFVVSLEALTPDWNRVNPAKGFERMFSMRGTAELMKGIAKILLIGWICWYEINSSLPDIIGAAGMPLPYFLSEIGSVIWAIAIRTAVFLAGLAIADYVFQKQQYEKMMRMSRQDMKQEMKQQDGDPLIKQRIRQKQRQMAKNRMMHAVPTADVVVTNPTHYAVALKYDPKSMTAPKVVAKGQDEIAMAIKELARESKVPLVENVPLARALYGSVKLGKDVPPELFRAVAEVLAYIYRVYGKRKS